MYRLLVVEDEPLVREGICSLIDHPNLGIGAVYQASDGERAWQLVQQHQPEIVLSDINMPGLDGISLAKRIKEQYPNTRIVFLTGYDAQSLTQSATTPQWVRWLWADPRSASIRLICRGRRRCSTGTRALRTPVLPVQCLATRRAVLPGWQTSSPSTGRLSPPVRLSSPDPSPNRCGLSAATPCTLTITNWGL